jgi:carbon-monoxide dehydrogenase large subunit
MQQSTDFRPSDLVGTSVQRREDPDLISGDAEYTDDIRHPDGLHLALCRSQYGHAHIESIETAAATALDGVVAAYTAADIEQSDAHGTLRTGSVDDKEVPEHPLLARETVTFQGQPVAAVVAEDRYTARDAVDAVDVTYDRRPGVVDPAAALADDAPTIHDDAPDNVAFEWDVGDEAAAEAALEAADHVVDVEVDINRVMPTAMEPRAAAARYDGSTGDLSVALTTQNPHEMRGDIAETLGLTEERIDARSPDVGGGFGGKLQPYPGYVLAAWCALEREQSISWTATRTEDLQSMVHSREHQVSVRVGVTDEGHIEGLQADTIAPVGGFLVPGGALVPKNIGKMANGQYDIPAVYVSTTGVFTNTAPLSAYRGAGRPEATYVIERVIREVARELGVDPVELRRRNFVRREQFPFETGLGRTYDSGDYEKTLAVALDRADYEAVRDRQERLRDEGRYLGIGVSAYVEACGVGPGTDEVGGVEVTSNGTVVVRAGTAEIGTGHRTAYAQVAAAELDVPLADVDVREGDTTVTSQGEGTFGSRAMPVAGNAIRESARTVRERAQRIAADRLEASEADVTLTDGEFHVRGAPDRSLSLSAVAELAEESDRPPVDVDGDGDSALDVTSRYDPPNYTFPFGTHVAVVEVDPDTGDVEVERYVAVDDVGTQINPGIVEGQVHGGIAQGLGQALYEEATYDDNGTLVRGSLQDYALPKADDVPEIEWTSTTTPSPHNPLGVKGVGEAGTIAAPPALVNAVADALEPLGVRELTMPLTQEQVWRAIHGNR